MNPKKINFVKHKQKIFSLIFLISILNGSFMISKGFSTEYPEVAKTKTITEITFGDADSSVDASNVTTNFGDGEYLFLSGHWERDGDIYGADRSYLRFPLSDKPDNWDTAEVSLHIPRIYEPTIIAVYLVSNDWEESTITWENQPAEGSLITTFEISKETVYTFDVSDYIEGDAISICVCYDDELSSTNGMGNQIVSKENPYTLTYDIPQITWTYEIELTITVLAPIASATWSFGDHIIRWETSEGIDDVDIELHKGSVKIDTLTFLYTENDGYYSWHIYKADSETYLTGEDYRIKILDDSDSEVYGFSEYFTVDTTIDPSKGEFICPFEGHTENFNAEKDHTYLFNYEFSNEQTFYIRIHDQEDKLLFEKKITSKTGSFEFTPDSTEVLIISIFIIEGDSCSYVKFSYIDTSKIPGYNLFFFLIALFGIVVCLIKKHKSKLLLEKK